MEQEPYQIEDMKPESSVTPAPDPVAYHNHDGVNSPPLAGGMMVLLKANSGTNTTTSANNLDTVDIGGLTKYDTLKIFVNVSAVTQNGGSLTLYNSTDAKNLLSLVNGTVLNTDTVISNAEIGQDQQSDINITSICMTNLINTATGSDLYSGYVNAKGIAVTTPWTGSWTLALRHGGVTSGGTIRWMWKVYKLLGQSS